MARRRGAPRRAATPGTRSAWAFRAFVAWLRQQPSQARLPRQALGLWADETCRCGHDHRAVAHRVGDGLIILVRNADRRTCRALLGRHAAIVDAAERDLRARRVPRLAGALLEALERVRAPLMRRPGMMVTC